MTCSETREYLFAFLDSELDAPLSIELQRHVERCHDCAREVEIERTIRRQLDANLDAQVGDYALDEGALKLAMAADAAPTRWAIRRFRRVGSALRRPRGAALLAAAASILIVFVSIWVIVPRSAPEGSGERFAIMVVDDFQHFLDKGQELQVESVDRAAVTDWLRARTSLEVILPTLDGSGCHLLGGRKCKFEGQAAAFAVYEVDGVPASLVAVGDENWNLEGMTRVDRAPRPDAGTTTEVGVVDRTYWVDSCKGHTVVAWKLGGLTYAAVSTVSTDKLLHLMAGMLHEGD